MKVHHWITAAVALGCAIGVRADLVPLPMPLDDGAGGGSGRSTRHGVPDYLNETSPTGSIWLATLQVADDIHRTTSLDIVGFDVGYSSSAGRPLNLSLFVYESFPDDDHLARPPALIASYVFPGMPGDGMAFVHLDLPDPLQAPADIWIAVSFNDPTFTTGLLITHPPTLGFSHDWFAVDTDADELIDTVLFFGDPVSFYMGVFVVPAPPAFLALLCPFLLYSVRRTRSRSCIRIQGR